jgi:hypothetical protein
MDKGGLFFFAVVKILVGYFSIRQGRGTLAIVNPVLKEYENAVAGVTQGIQMTERKSKNIEAHISELKKLIIATIFVGIIAMGYAKDWLNTEADQFIDQFYSSMNTTNTTSNSSILDLQYITPFFEDEEEPVYEEEPVQEEEPEQIHFNPHSGNITAVTHNTTDNSTAPVRNESHHNIRGGPNEHIGHHHTHLEIPDATPSKSRMARSQGTYVDPNMQDLLDKLSSMDEEEAK